MHRFAHFVNLLLHIVFLFTNTKRLLRWVSSAQPSSPLLSPSAHSFTLLGVGVVKRTKEQRTHWNKLSECDREKKNVVKFNTVAQFRLVQRVVVGGGCCALFFYSFEFPFGCTNRILWVRFVPCKHKRSIGTTIEQHVSGCCSFEQRNKKRGCRASLVLLNGELCPMVFCAVGFNAA